MPPFLRVVRELRRGGMGAVYEAIDTRTSTPVALKTMLAVDGSSTLSLKRELRSLIEISHPNLVRFGELFRTDDGWSFTMELIEGGDFLSYVRGGAVARGAAPVFDEARLRAALLQLAEGLAALHAHGKVHRDLKPANILVSVEGRVVILDFGLVGNLVEMNEAAEDSRVFGTPMYMALEQIASPSVGAAADWYSAGVVLFVALTGAVPFTGRDAKILTDKQLFDGPRPRADGLALLVRAAVHEAEGALPQRQEALRRACTVLAAVDMAPLVEAARLALAAALPGPQGAELAAPATAALRARGVRAVARFARMCLPGLSIDRLRE